MRTDPWKYPIAHRTCSAGTMGISAVTPTVAFVTHLILERTSHTSAFASFQSILGIHCLACCRKIVVLSQVRLKRPPHAAHCGSRITPMTWCTSTCLSPSPATSWLQSTPRTLAEVKEQAVCLVLRGQFTQMKSSFVLPKQRKKTATGPSPVSLIFLLNRTCWCQHTMPLVFERFLLFSAC